MGTIKGAWFIRTPLRHVSLAGVFALVVLAAHAPAGAPVAVNLVWLVAQTTVKGKVS